MRVVGNGMARSEGLRVGRVQFLQGMILHSLVCGSNAQLTTDTRFPLKARLLRNTITPTLGVTLKSYKNSESRVNDI